tara:strand:- start:3280 stop:4689 length:1410 start_codon:yes stop_codon:yes gene_type:complete
MIENDSKPKFGTDGWRGIIGKNFNSKNCFIVASSLLTLSNSISKVVIGYDTRDLSKEISFKISNFYKSKGIRVILSESPIPTPVVSFSVKNQNADFGIIITASHNSKIWNGIKIKNKNGQSINEVEANKLTNIIENHNINKIDLDIFESTNNDLYGVDLLTEYIKSIRKIVDIETVRKSNMNVIIDCMFGTSKSIFKKIIGEGNIKVSEINDIQDSSFPGIKQPEPIEENLNNLKNKVTNSNADIGFAFDADSDRVGIIDNKSNYLESPYVFCIIADHVLKTKNRRNISTTVSMTSMIDEIVKKYGVKCFRTKVGFKYVAPNMEKNNSILGGEESGGYSYSEHLLERDGIASSLLILEKIINSRLISSNLMEDLSIRYGNYFYKRLDIELKENIFEKFKYFISNFDESKIINQEIRNIDREDGIKIIFKNNEWILVRLSGTEPLARIYAESKNKDSVNLLISKFSKLFI